MDVSNLSPGDSRAEATSQLTGVFLVGLGLASLLMRPQAVTGDDLINLVDGVEASIRDIRQEINSLQKVADVTNTQLTSIVREIRELDFSAVEGLAQTVALVITEVQSLAVQVEKLLDLEVDVDLDPVMARVAQSQQELTALISALRADGDNSADFHDLTEKLLMIDRSVLEGVQSLTDKILSLDTGDHQDRIEDMLRTVKGVSEAHKAGFDEFITHLGAN